MSADEQIAELRKQLAALTQRVDAMERFPSELAQEFKRRVAEMPPLFPQESVEVSGAQPI